MKLCIGSQIHILICCRSLYVVCVGVHPQKLASLQALGKGDQAKAVTQYRAKLKSCEEKLSSLQKKLAGHAKLERLKTQSEEAAKRLTVDIQGMKRQRVEMLKKMEKLSRDAAEERKCQVGARWRSCAPLCVGGRGGPPRCNPTWGGLWATMGWSFHTGVGWVSAMNIEYWAWTLKVTEGLA